MTMMLPKQDILSQRRKQLMDDLAVTMGGRIAEKMVADDISSGASGDIQMATATAKAMIMHWGMSEKLGMIQYGDNQEYMYLGRDMMRTKDYSEKTAQEIDDEVKRLIDESYHRAEELIVAHRDKLELIAKALLEYETLDGVQVAEIVNTGKFTPPPVRPNEIDPPSGAPAGTPLPEVIKPRPPELPGLGTPAPAAV